MICQRTRGSAPAKAIALALLVAAPVSAQEWAHAGAGDRLALNPAVDYALTGAGLAAYVVPELLKQSIAPAACRVCDGRLDGVDSFFHDGLTGRWVSRRAADEASDVLGFGVLPAAAALSAAFATGPFATRGAGLRSAFIVFESSVLSAAAVQSVKLLVARERPFARYGHAGEPGYDATDRDSHLGFPSGHTALAASLGVSAAMTASLQESRAAPWMWGAAAVTTVATGTLRMMAEKHYFTDVAAGAALGAASGVLVPLLHRRGSALSESSVAVGPMTLSLAGSF